MRNPLSVRSDFSPVAFEVVLTVITCWCAVVGQGEGVATVENQLVDDPQTGKFTWTIVNFSKINLRKHYSETFTVGGYKWLALDLHLWYSCTAWIRKYHRADISSRFCYMFVVAGGCYYFPKAIMWITCRFTWMLRIPHSFPMAGVDLHILLWQL